MMVMYFDAMRVEVTMNGFERVDMMIYMHHRHHGVVNEDWNWLPSGGDHHEVVVDVVAVVELNRNVVTELTTKDVNRIHVYHLIEHCVVVVDDIVVVGE